MKKIYKIYFIFSVSVALLAACNNNSNTSHHDSVIHETLFVNAPVAVAEGVLIYKEDTFFSRAKAIEIGKNELKQNANDACKKLLGTWKHSGGKVVLTVSQKNNSYYAEYYVLNSLIDSWYMKCNGSEFPVLSPIGDGHTITYLPSGKVELSGYGNGTPFTR